MRSRIRFVVRAVLWAGCVFAPWSLPGANNLLDHYTYTSYQEGLPQNTVKAVAQTRDGYLWFGTRFGLVRFDGINFKVYDPSSEPPLLYDNCSGLLEDRIDGTLWIAQPSRITAFKDGQFTSWEITSPDQTPALMRQFCAAPNGGLWIGADHGLLRFQNGQVQRRYTVEDGLKTNAVRSIFLDEMEQLWIGTTVGLQKMNTRTGEIIDLTEMDSRLAGSTTCVHMSEGELWVANAFGIHLRRDDRWSTLAALSDGDGVVEFMERDSSGKLWMGGSRFALSCFDHGRWVKLNSRRAFVNGSHCMREDHEGNLWFGTPYDGVARLHPHDIITFSRRDGLLHDDVWSLCEGFGGVVWVGGLGGVTQLREGRFKTYPMQGAEGPAHVKCIYEDSQGTLWAGTKDAGLQKRSHQGWQPVPLEGDLRENEVSAITEDRRGILWVATRKALYSRQGGEFVPFRADGQHSIPEVRAILEDRAGNLWFGTYRSGLYRFRDGQLNVFTKLSGLPSDCAWALYEDSEGVLWIGTNNGLARFKNGLFVSFTKKQGLFDNVVNSILEDAQHNFWISCNRGIYEVPRRELEDVAERRRARVSFIAYGTSDGMLDRETNGGTQPSAMKTRDGSLWFPTVKGAVHLDPEKTTRNLLAPPLVIEEVMVNGKAIDPTRPANLPAGSGGVVQIHYTGNSFVAPEKVLFAYCLRGCDRDWSEPTPYRVAYYTNLKPGQYKFQVKACNNHGVWNVSPATFSFRIAPHFYETYPFYVLCGISVILAGAGFHRRRVGILTKIQRLEQQHALERERARIAQEMHDDLGASLTQIGLLGELAHRELGHPVSAEAHLQKLKLTTRDLFRSMDEIVWAVNPTHDTLPSLVDYICHYAQQYLRLAEIRFRLDRPEDLPNQPLTSEERHNLFLAIKEALNNIVKHAAATEVRLRIQVVTHRLEIILEDNGRGFDPEAIDSTRQGLANMRERLRAIGGCFEISSAPGQGSKVRFQLPERVPRNGSERLRPSKPRHE